MEEVNAKIARIKNNIEALEDMNGFLNDKAVSNEIRRLKIMLKKLEGDNKNV